MAALWRARWLALAAIGFDDLRVDARLEDLARPGAPSGLSADQVWLIEPLACSSPEQARRPISQWTGPAIADELMKRGSVAHSSRRHAARVLDNGAANRTGC